MVTRFIAVCISLSVTAGIHGEERRCTRDEAIKAESEAPSLKTWKDVYVSYTKYCHCDDGAISEGYSASVASLLAEHWDRLKEVVVLTTEHPKFECFLLRHIDETMTEDEGRIIEEYARSHCPRDASRLCGLIKQRFVNLRSH